MVDFTKSGLDPCSPGFAGHRLSYNVHAQGYMIDNMPEEIDDHALVAYSISPSTLSSQAISSTGTSASALSQMPDGFQYRALPVRRRAEPVAALEFWDNLFLPAMEQLTTTHPVEPEEVKKHCSIRDQSNWTGVYSKLEAAKTSYSQIDKSFKSTLRKVYRKVADQAGGAKSFTKSVSGLVDNDYASPVLGAVQLILEAAAKAARLRQDMLGAFDDIDRNFTEVEVYQQEFPGDDNIKAASIDLVASVLYAVELVIGFFVSKPYKRILRATFTIDEYRKKIDTSLNDIDEKSKGLLREVGMSKTQRDYAFQAQSRTDALLTHYGVAILQSMLHGSENKIQNLVNILIHKIDNLESKVSHPPTSRPLTPTHAIMAPPSPSPSTPYRGISAQDLLDWINISDFATHDLRYLESCNHIHISDTELGRAEQLVTHHQLQHWLGVPAASQLLIHGHHDGGLIPVSGLSLLCATLAIHFTRHPRIIRLVFFCGLHADYDDASDSDYDSEDDADINGGCAMMSNFICQLLCAFDFGPNLPIDAKCEDAVVDGDVDELCNIFSTLVRLLPRGLVLVCIIDGAAYYERPEFLDETSEVVSSILKLSMDDSVQAIFKVLIASSTQTTYIRRPFPDETILSMAGMADAGWEHCDARVERILSSEGSIAGDNDAEFDDRGAI